MIFVLYAKFSMNGKIEVINLFNRTLWIHVVIGIFEKVLDFWNIFGI